MLIDLLSFFVSFTFVAFDSVWVVHIRKNGNFLRIGITDANFKIFDLPKGGAERTTGRPLCLVQHLVPRRHAPNRRRSNAEKYLRSTRRMSVSQAPAGLDTPERPTNGDQETHSFTELTSKGLFGYRAEQYHSAVPLARTARTCTTPGLVTAHVKCTYAASVR